MPWRHHRSSPRPGTGRARPLQRGPVHGVLARVGRPTSRRVPRAHRQATHRRQMGGSQQGGRGDAERTE
eukprot:3652187-Alexandrium_andersonii.AAC.1